MILTGLLILASGFIIITLVSTPAVSRWIWALFHPTRHASKVHYAWMIIGILSVTQIVVMSISMASGIMVAPLNDPDGDFGWGMGVIGGGLAMYFLVGALFSPLAGWLGDRYGVRKILIVCGVLFAVGMISLGFVTTLWQFFLVFGVILAVTEAISFVSLITAANIWFRRRLGMAVGILWAAGGIGSAALAPLVAYLLETVGWERAFVYIGVVGGGVILLLVPFFRNRPVDMGIEPYGTRSDDAPEVQWSGWAQNLRLKVFNQHIRMTKEFWNLPLIHALGCAGHGIILIYSIPIAVEQGISLTAAALILSLINIFSVISRFITPIVTERMGAKPAMTVALALQGITVIILFGAQEPWSFYLFAVLFGIGFGGEMSAYPVVNRQYFGDGPMGTFFGIETMGALLGHAVATALAGFILFATGTFTPILILSMGFSFTGVAVILTLAPSTNVLIPDWEQSLPPDARSEAARARPAITGQTS